MRDVVVIDYGSGNTRSMINALRQVLSPDQRVILTRDADRIASADRLILPGVGAFAECRRRLDGTGLLPTIARAVDQGRPFLGVCVGMQILADEGQEFTVAPGLGWIPGVTRQIEFTAQHQRPKKLPHVGWSPVAVGDHPLFANIADGSYFYFVHSFTLQCKCREHIAATAEYGETLTAAVIKDNIFGCQFHPEKSANAGLRVLEAFCRWQPC